MTDYPNYKSPAERKKDRIRADIVMLDKALESGGERIMLQVHQHIDGKYQACIAGWNQGVFGYVPGYGFHYDVIGEESLRHNLQMMKPKLEGFVEGWNAIAAPATTATIPEINVNTTEKVPDLMQFQVWYFFFYVGRCPEWVQFRLFLCKAEAADGCGTLSCGLFVAVMSRCFAGTKQMAGAE